MFRRRMLASLAQMLLLLSFRAECVVAGDNKQSPPPPITAAGCADDPSFVDAAGYRCPAWRKVACTHLLGDDIYAGKYTADDAREVRRRCPAACGLCWRAPGRARAASAPVNLATAALRLTEALRAVLQHAPAASARHLAIGDAALPYAHAYAVARTIGVASSMATARLGAVKAYRAATALGDRSFVGREGKAFDEFCNGLQEDASRAAMAIVDDGEIGKASIILRKVINMAPATKVAVNAARFIRAFRSARSSKGPIPDDDFLTPPHEETSALLVNRITRASRALQRRLCNARVAPKKRVPGLEEGWACAPGRPCTQEQVNNELALTCDRNATMRVAHRILHSGGVRRTLSGFYHVGLVNNWRDVVADQLATLVNCGVLDVARSLTISYHQSNASLRDVAELKRIVLAHTGGVAAEVRLVPSSVNSAPWEAAAIELVAGHCSSADPGIERLVFYMHTKGVTWYRPNWLVHFGRYRNYAPVLYWRKYLEYFIIQHPHWCLAALAGGAGTCGVDLHTCGVPPHYSGNFWFARCDYVRTLPSSVQSDKYDTTEMWIGQGMVKSAASDLNRDGGPGVGPKHVSLFESQEARWMPHTIVARTLYEDVFHPAEYSSLPVS